MTDAGFVPRTSSPEVWCANNEPPHLLKLLPFNKSVISGTKRVHYRSVLAPTEREKRARRREQKKRQAGEREQRKERRKAQREERQEKGRVQKRKEA